MSNAPGAAIASGATKNKYMKQVTQTSIESYRTLDHTTLRGRIGGWIVTMSRINRPVTIREVSTYFILDKSTASARLNELKKQPFEWEGKFYRLEFAGKVFDNLTCKTVEAWRAVPAADPGQQKDLFTL